MCWPDEQEKSKQKNNTDEKDKKEEIKKKGVLDERNRKDVLVG